MLLMVMLIIHFLLVDELVAEMVGGPVQLDADMLNLQEIVPWVLKLVIDLKIVNGVVVV